MKRLSYLLVLLLISAQVDDSWAVAAVLAAAPRADGNDEYLPAQQRPQEQRPSSCPQPVFEAVKLPHADFSFVPRGAPSEWNLTTACGPAPLYVFMSLQI